MREEEGGLRRKRNMFEACRSFRDKKCKIVGWPRAGKREVWKWWSGLIGVRRAEMAAAQPVCSSSRLHSAHTRWLASRVLTVLMPSSKELIKTQLSYCSGKPHFTTFMCREDFPPTLLSLFKYVFLLLLNETDIQISIIVCQRFRVMEKTFL